MQLSIEKDSLKLPKTQFFQKVLNGDCVQNAVQAQSKARSEHLTQYLSHLWANIENKNNFYFKKNQQHSYSSQNIDKDFIFSKNFIQKYKQKLIDYFRTSIQQIDDIEIILKNGQIIQNQNKCTIELFQQSSQSKFITFLVKISIFKVKIKVLNFQKQLQSCIDSFNLIDKGSFGYIYQRKIFKNQLGFDKNKWVSKRFYFHSFLNYEELGHIIKEYAFLKIFSFLKIGLKVIKPTDFDILCFKQYCEFFMEKGQIIQNIQFKKTQADLYQNLRVIHSLQIVHNDIKPDNIMYSKEFKKIVFIDFGITQGLHQKIGQKTQTLYKGTLNYCSDEMQKIYFKKQNAQIDLYWNDFCCMKASLIQIAHQKSKQKTQKYKQNKLKKYEQTPYSMPETKQIKYKPCQLLFNKNLYPYQQVMFISYLYHSQFDLFQQKFRMMNQNYKQWISLEIIDTFLDLFPTPEVQNIFKKYFSKYLTNQRIDQNVKQKLKVKYYSDKSLFQNLNIPSNSQLNMKSGINYKLRYKNIQAHLSFAQRDLTYKNLIKCIQNQDSQNQPQLYSTAQKVESKVFKKKYLHLLVNIINFLHSHLLITPLKQVIKVLKHYDKYLQNCFLKFYSQQLILNTSQKEQQKIILYLKIVENYLFNDEKKQIDEWNIIQKVIQIYSFIKNDELYVILIQKFIKEYKFYIPLRKKVFYYYLLYEKYLDFYFQDFINSVQTAIKQSEKNHQQVLQEDINFIQTLKNMASFVQKQNNYCLIHNSKAQSILQKKDLNESFIEILIKKEDNLHKLDRCCCSSIKKENKQNSYCVNQNQEKYRSERNSFVKIELQRYSQIFLELSKKIQKEAFTCYVIVQLKLIKRLIQRFQCSQVIFKCQKVLKKCGAKDFRLYSQQISLVYMRLAQSYQLSGAFEKAIYYSKKCKSQLYSKALQFCILMKNNDITIQKSKQMFSQCIQLIFKEYKQKTQKNQKFFWNKTVAMIFFFGASLIQDSQMNEILENLKSVFTNSEILHIRQRKNSGYLANIYNKQFSNQEKWEGKNPHTLLVLKRFLNDAETFTKTDSQFSQMYWQMKLMVTLKYEQNQQKVISIQKRYLTQFSQRDLVQTTIFWLVYHSKMINKFQNVISANKFVKIIHTTLKGYYNVLLLDPTFWFFNVEYIKIHLKNGNFKGIFQFMNALSDISQQNKHLEKFCSFNYFFFVQCIQESKIIQIYKEQMYKYLEHILLNNYFQCFSPQIYSFFYMIWYKNPIKKDQNCIKILKLITKNAQNYDLLFRKVLSRKNSQYLYDPDSKQSYNKRVHLLKQIDKQKYFNFKSRNNQVRKNTNIIKKLKNKVQKWKFISQSCQQYQDGVFNKIYKKKLAF